MSQTANDNYRAATQGESFYPEMGGRHDGKSLFVARVGYGGYYIIWSPARHTEALAAFKRLRIRPRSMELSDQISGGKAWSCGVTWEAGRKLRPLSVAEMLLD